MEQNGSTATRSSDAPAPRAIEPALIEAVRALRADARVAAGLAEIYARADSAARRQGARCLGGGACCKFDLVGHRLFASTAELAFLSAAAPADLARCARGRCPYQLGPRCTAHSRRPLGCRVYFCEAALTARAAGVYEELHGRVRDLHESLRVPYFYAELVSATACIFGAAQQAGACSTGRNLT